MRLCYLLLLTKCLKIHIKVFFSLSFLYIHNTGPPPIYLGMNQRFYTLYLGKADLSFHQFTYPSSYFFSEWERKIHVSVVVPLVGNRVERC